MFSTFSSPCFGSKTVYCIPTDTGKISSCVVFGFNCIRVLHLINVGLYMHILYIIHIAYTIEIDTLEYQQTEKIETELEDVDRIRSRKVYACCPGWHSGGS